MKKRKLHLHRETLVPLTSLDTTSAGRVPQETEITLCFTCPCPPSIFTDCTF